MAHDPDNLKNYFMPDREVTLGHYSNRADLDDLVSGPFEEVVPEQLEQALQVAGRDLSRNQQQALRSLARGAVYGTGESR